MSEIFNLISTIIGNILDLIVLVTNLLLKNPLFIILISIPILSIIISLIYSLITLNRRNKVKVRYEGKTYWINKSTEDKDDMLIGYYPDKEYDKYNMDDEDFDLTSEQLWNKYHGYKYK